MGQGTPRDSALPMARIAGDAERPTTSRQCAGQCEDSSRTIDHQGAAGQSMISGRVTSPGQRN